MAEDKPVPSTLTATEFKKVEPSEAEKFQVELNALMAKYPTVKLVVTQSITISEKQ